MTNPSVDWNIDNQHKGKSLEEIQQFQRDKSLPFGVCALNITGDLNVGIMARTACLTGASKFFVYGRRRFDRRSTVGAQNYIDIVRQDGLNDDGSYDVDLFYNMMDNHNFVPVFIEQGGMSVSRHNPVNWPVAPCYVFGNEGEGIPEYLIRPGFPVLTLSQRGVLRSYNVSSAASIVMYSIMEKYYG